VEVIEVAKLGFGKCQLCVQTPKAKQVKDVKELIGKRIVTSFPHITKEYFSAMDPEHKTNIKIVSGSVEVSCALGIADAVVDLVESGATMRAAGLEICSVVMDTEAVLIKNPESSPEHRSLIEKLRKRINGVMIASHFVMVEYNIRKEKLAGAIKITPGQKAPTINPLSDSDWVAVKAMVPDTQINDIMDQLEDIEANSIITTKIDNCR